jgi:MoaA/NifB/PqqE/SkfB family radical SAM enzyme
VSDLAGRLREAIEGGRLGPRLWLYANYHCNLACGYCLTESAPDAPRRVLDAGLMRDLVDEAAGLGFESVGVTGGEPFLRPEIPALLADLARTLPVVALTNGTLFAGARMDSLAPLRGADVTLQISLDSDTPERNDGMRAPGNLAKVVDAVPRLIAAGIRVRIATTVYDQDEAEIARVAALVGALGVAPEDHLVRPTTLRGRAAAIGLGERVGTDNLPAEATVTADGLFWSPFAPTVRGGRLDTDLLVSRQVAPLAPGLATMLGLITGTPLAEASRFR